MRYTEWYVVEVPLTVGNHRDIMSGFPLHAVPDPAGAARSGTSIEDECPGREAMACGRLFDVQRESRRDRH